MSSTEEGSVFSFEADVDGPVESTDISGGSLLLLEATPGVDLSVP
jgi:hypothetical protein